MKIIYIPVALSLPFLLTQCGGKAPTSGNTATVGNAAVDQTAREKALASEIYQALNDYRKSQGQPAIKRSSKLDSIANTKSASMAVSNNLTSGTFTPPPGQTSLGQAVASFGDRDNTAAKFINYWKTKGGLLLGNWSNLGVGVKINDAGLAYSALSLEAGK